MHTSTQVTSIDFEHKFQVGDIISSPAFPDDPYQVARVRLTADGDVKYTLFYTSYGTMKEHAGTEFGEFYERGDIDRYSIWAEPTEDIVPVTYSVTLDMVDDFTKRVELEDELFETALRYSAKGGFVGTDYVWDAK